MCSVRWRVLSFFIDCFKTFASKRKPSCVKAGKSLVQGRMKPSCEGSQEPSTENNETELCEGRQEPSTEKEETDVCEDPAVMQRATAGCEKIGGEFIFDQRDSSQYKVCVGLTEKGNYKHEEHQGCVRTEAACRRNKVNLD